MSHEGALRRKVPARIWRAIALLVVTLAPGTWAADSDAPLTFYRDVLPIVQENCQSCHRPFGVNRGGMVAPMSFMTYDEVRPWAKSIARAVSTREMPPWLAAPELNGVFKNELTLTDYEIDTLVRWSRQGTLEGDSSDGPQAVQWINADWKYGEPDLIVALPEPYFVSDDIDDTYVDFLVTITPEMMPVPRFIRASEARGGSRAVHHLIARPLGFMAPGGGHKEYPEGYGKLVQAGDEVLFNMHYHKEPGPGTGVWDQSMVALWFHPLDEPIRHQVWTGAIGHWDFEIPPGAPDWKVGASLTFVNDAILLGLAPHMHLRGTRARVNAFYPDGTTEVLLDAEYDFYWQARYDFKEPRYMPANTRVEFIAHFDNTAANEYNPNPEIAISFGDPTTSEMSLCFVDWTNAEPRR